MPPVASSWGDAIKGALEANEEAGSSPDSWRSLAAALARQEDSPQTAASWKKTLSRIAKGDSEPKEPAAKAISVALGVPRSSLPAPAAPTTIREVSARLEEVSAEAARLEDLDRMLGPLREAIRLTASGDRQGALRALSEGDE